MASVSRKLGCSSIKGPKETPVAFALALSAFPANWQMLSVGRGHEIEGGGKEVCWSTSSFFSSLSYSSRIQISHRLPNAVVSAFTTNHARLLSPGACTF